MMQTIRTARILAASAGATLLLATVAPAADAPQPTAKIKATITPKKISSHGGVGTPVKLAITSTFGTDTPGAAPFVITSAIVKFPKGALANGRFFPSCSAKKLNRNGGILSKCPKKSIIGGGTATARANDLTPPITATGKVKLLNGRGGKSIVFNIDVKRPAVINRSFEAKLTKLHGGKYGYQLALKVPHDLRFIAFSDIAVTKFVVSTFATTVVHGVRRGYIEGLKCPKSGKAPIHLDVNYDGGGSTSTDSSIKCSR
jgi:hypothetical protein